MRSVWLILVLLTACSEPEPAPPSGGATAERAPRPAGEATEPPPTEPVEPVGPSCDELLADARERLDAPVGEHRACEFDVDCVAVEVAASCVPGCETAIHPRGLAAVDESRAAVEADACPRLAERGCEATAAECDEGTPRCSDGACVMDDAPPPAREAEVPPENALARADDPPERPAAGEPEQERARRLFEAIVSDEPDLAQDFFFPEEAFRRVKGIADPDRYWERLFERYRGDIHALHGSLDDLDRAEFDRLEIVRRGGWVRPREEANALPYWAARHDRLHYRVDGEDRTLEVRVLITWGRRWYVTHLSEFH